MRKLNILPMFLLFATSLVAQTKTDKAHVNWGTDMTVKEDGLFDEIVGDKDNTIFMLMHRKKDLFMQRTDGLKVAWQKPVDLERDKKDMTLRTVILTKSEIMVFSTYYDKKLDENSLYLSSYDQDGFKPLKRFEKIANIHAEKSKNTGGFIISASPDGTKVLVEVDRPFEKEEAKKFQLNMFDESMAPLWSQDCTLPYDDGKFSAQSVRVDNDGVIIVLGKKYLEKQEEREMKKAGKATYEYHLLVFKESSPAPQDYPIVVADKFLQDMTISMGQEGDIVCAGLFGNKGSFSVRGAFYLRLDRASKSIGHESYMDFSDDLITSYMTEKEANKAKKKADKKDEELELPEFDLHDLIRRDDGGAVLIAEQYFMRIVTVTSSNPNGGTVTTTTYHYYYNDVIAVNISPEGNVEWAAKVPKRQHSVNDGGVFSGCAVAVKGSNIYLVFNDSGENLFLKQGDKVKQFELKGKDALVVLATIDGDGKVSREALFSPDRRDVILRPQDCVDLENEEMFIYASRKNDYRFGLLEFK